MKNSEIIISLNNKKSIKNKNLIETDEKMIFQLSGTVSFIIWLIVTTILLGLFIYLATRWIISKTRAHDKLFMIFLCALICVLLIPIVGMAVGYVFGLGDYITNLTNGPNFLMSLVAVIQFLVVIILVKIFVSESWSDSVWISLIAFILLFLLYTIFPVLYYNVF